MRDATSRALLCLSLALVLFPLVLETPGWPGGFKADEPAYYLIALSLVRDGDLLCDQEDLRRLFDEFPFQPVRNVILASDDGWETVVFGKPYVYSLFAAPAVHLFGANGMVAFNMALLMAMIWIGFQYLARFNSRATAGLFSAGFFLFSSAFAYVFWLQPEIFNMAAITVCLYLGLDGRREDRVGESTPGVLRSPVTRMALSGASIVLAAYHKPMLGLLGLPVVLMLVRWRRFRGLAGWILGAAACSLIVVAGSYALIGHGSAYLGLTRVGFTVHAPDHMPVPEPEPPVAVSGAETGSEEKEAPRNSWAWIFRIPPIEGAELAEDLGYFLWGRHTGLLLYMPFSAVALVLFLLHGRRSGARWAVLGSLVLVALSFLLLIPFNWHGGGGFVGNRYFVNAYPCFLFLVTRVAPAMGTLVVGYAVGSLLLGPTMFSPWGRWIPSPTLQAHVRNFPFPHFPLELSLRELPGYTKEGIGGVFFMGRKDVVRPRGKALWIRGATSAELWLQSFEPLDKLTFRVKSVAEENEVTLRTEGDERQVSFGAAGTPASLVHLEPSGPTRIRVDRGKRIWAYRMEVDTETGEVCTWSEEDPAPRCDGYWPNRSWTDSFYVGAELLYLPRPELLGADVFGVEWGSIEAPARAAADEELRISVELRNTSGVTWPAEPPVRVALGHWWSRLGSRDSRPKRERQGLGRPVGPGEEVLLTLETRAPQEPGRYILELDLVFEHVAWFSRRSGDETQRVPIEVVDGGGMDVPAER